MTAGKPGVKRKQGQLPLPSRKKTKTVHLTTDDLPWKTISRPKEADLGDGFDGLLELEEVDDVQVVYEETEGGKVVKFKVAGEKSEEDERGAAPSEDMTVLDEESPEGEGSETVPDLPEESFDSESKMPNWHPFSLHPRLFRALHSEQFLTPTPIQAAALPLALKGRDVVGVAETGSGKTLAYGLPILHYLLMQATHTAGKTAQSRRELRALILAPTRELALQVSSHLNTCLNHLAAESSSASGDNKAQETDQGSSVPADAETSEGQGRKKGKVKQKRQSGDVTAGPKVPPLVSVVAIVGGMSAQKQRRLLSRGVDVLVATPGRLWDIIQEDDELANQIEKLRFLVLDEADRMIEAGHFAEMENILRLTLRQAEDDEVEPVPDMGLGAAEREDAEDSKQGVKEGEMQTFVFSATLSKDLQRNLKKRARPTKRRNDKPASTLDDLLMRLDFRDPSPAVIDLSPEGGVVATLQESKIECLSSDKDAYLYYFLLRYPGRTLVFLSAIDGIRRLLPLMDLLGLPAFPLHSQLEQRQRLKNLDRFKSTPHGVLLATDVAARGLDIPAVDHVVHYQAPRTADAYVHRNGRTARAMRRGFSLLMCAPDERKIVRALMRSLGRQDEIPEMPMELHMLDKLKARTQLARQIDSAQHKVRKENHDRNWLKEAAEAMEIELDSDFASASEGEGEGAPSKRVRKATNAKTAAMKAELKQLLAQPLVARGVSTRYITSGSTSIADDMLAGEYHETMVGLKKVEAGSDLVPVKKRKKSKVKAEVEEWNGFSSEN
ncbi:ATP-dependent RNA helicase MAK5 [Sparassis crispa]|uniref:RNA helicase n=1 Tax=Sparassis crispa TaxID=139825 RepID=A0A401H315_9APHY|nr:ATP-dependent RNA helicase MAK5 [Sparassis crispa]GBE88760.1 ATP-dependent RNA helicase MAK5 [Sparassis crispa]